MSVIRKMLQLWRHVTYPVRWVVAHLVLSLVFFVIITPVAIALRICGYDAMQRKWRADADSYWKKREREPDVESYFHQI